MLKRLNKDTGPDDDEMEKLFAEHLEKTYKWLAHQENIEVLYINYLHAIESPVKIAETTKKFLNRELDIEKMGQVIDPSLYRNRKE